MEKRKQGRPRINRNKRIAVSLDDDLHALLSELATVSDTTISTIVYSMLDESRGHFNDLIGIITDSKQGAVNQAKDRLYKMAIEMGAQSCIALEEVEKIQKEKE